MKVAVFDIVSPQQQIAAEVDSVLRSTLPTMTLDESYEAKEKMVAEILSSVREALPIGPRVLACCLLGHGAIWL